MQLLYRTVVQLEEAKRFILDGDVERLRLALILLDNAAEVIMNRFIDGEVSHARTYAKLLKMFPKGPLDVKSKALKREFEEKIIPSRRQRKIEHNFNEKLTYLSNDCRCLPTPTARALRRLHKYRNETQHHDLIREGSIRPAVLVFGTLRHRRGPPRKPPYRSGMGFQRRLWMATEVRVLRCLHPLPLASHRRRRLTITHRHWAPV